VNSIGRLGLFVNVFQPIKIIFLLRHPCGVVFSILKGIERGEKNPSPRNEIRELIDSRMDFARQLSAKLDKYDPLELEAFRWAVLNSKALRELKDRSECVILKYEDLYASPITEMRNVLHSVGVPWDTQVERFIRLSTSKSSRSYYGLYRKPENIDHWRQSMPLAAQNRVLEFVRGSTAGELYVD
jgi:hypothetical protein